MSKTTPQREYWEDKFGYYHIDRNGLGYQTFDTTESTREVDSSATQQNSEKEEN